MKKLIYAILFSSLSLSLLADCMSKGIWAYPQSKTINTDAIIILETYGETQELVPKLNTNLSIHLKAYNHCVNLEIVEVLKGDLNLTQVVLRAEQQLDEGISYKLEIDSNSYCSGTALKLHGRWTTAEWLAKNKSLKKLELENIKHIDNTITSYGCGPDMQATFSTNIIDTNSNMLKAQMLGKTAADTTTFIVSIDNVGQVLIGHGMCCGGFKFHEKKYFIRFKHFDFTETAYSYTDWIEFEAPTFKTESGIIKF